MTYILETTKNFIMVKGTRKVPVFVTYLLLIFLLVFVYYTMKGDVTTGSGASLEVPNKPNFFQSSIKDTPKDKTMSKSDLKVKKTESSLDIKFFFLGVRKCGTTAFQKFVSQHPDIRITIPQPSVCHNQQRLFNFKKEIQPFLKSANKTNEVAIVKSNQCFQNVTAFDTLKKPSKIILLLCDPTLRAFSDYKFVFEWKKFTPRRSFEEVVPEAISAIEAHKNDKSFAEIMRRIQEKEHLDYAIVFMGFYYEYIKEYFRRYKPENILILSGAELKQDPYLVMHQLESFLGVRHYLDKSKFVRNEANGMYCIRSKTGKANCVRPRDTKFRRPDAATIEMLRQLYRPYNEKLFQLLNRTFPWL